MLKTFWNEGIVFGIAKIDMFIESVIVGIKWARIAIKSGCTSMQTLTTMTPGIDQELDDLANKILNRAQRFCVF